MALERTIKTADDAADDVFTALVTAGVKTAVNLTGAIHLWNEPLNSDLENIVVKTLGLSADQMQEGVINVNIHVPNLNLTDDNSQPNRPRFNTIGASCIQALDSFFGVNFNFSIESPGVLVPDGKDWFMNIRLRYYSVREDIN
ncbi:MAG: hypothetical protein Q8R83_06095 [Legionellaceae bacterium]|nr:hypothetical protein [Legionellaceae bacterium]